MEIIHTVEREIDIPSWKIEFLREYEAMCQFRCMILNLLMEF